jgi:hypothetical protein
VERSEQHRAERPDRVAATLDQRPARRASVGVAAHRLTPVSTRVNVAPCAAPAASAHSHQAPGRASMPRGNSIQSTVTTAKPTWMRPARRTDDISSGPAAPVSWNTAALPPAITRPNPMRSSSWVGSQAVMP